MSGRDSDHVVRLQATTWRPRVTKARRGPAGVIKAVDPMLSLRTQARL